MFRKDRDRFGESIMFYVNKRIPSKVLSLESIPMDIEIILLKFTIKNRRLLCIGIYRPLSQNEKCQYKKTMLIGDFNLTIYNESLENFMSTCDLEYLIRKPTCFQSSNPTCIDLILTIKKEFFKNTDVVEVEISDHHYLIVTALKSLPLKRNAKTKLYQDYSSFSTDHFEEDLGNNL